MKYKFRIVDSEEWNRRRGCSGKIMNPWEKHVPIENFSGDKLGKYTARFRGSLLTLFGKPSETSSFADEAYTYFIEAKDSNNATWILTAYSGSSGPAIGGDRRMDGIMDVVEALAAYIDSATPADFEATIYDDDTDNTIRYGCKDGDCYYEEKKGDHR